MKIFSISFFVFSLICCSSLTAAFTNSRFLNDEQTQNEIAGNQEESLKPENEEQSESYLYFDDSIEMFMAEWSEYMINFDSSQMFTFELKAGGTAIFYEDVLSVPQMIRGTYSISTNKDNKIIFTIIGPRKSEVVLTKEYEKEVIFHPNATYPGRYKLKFENHNVIFSHIILGFF